MSEHTTEGDSAQVSHFTGIPTCVECDVMILIPTHARERPRCREVIIERGLTPWPSPSEWDSRTAKRPDGTRTNLSDGLRKQMGVMLAEGFWPLTCRDCLEEKERESLEDGQSENIPY